ncbi:MAG: glycosyltransferase [Flavobacteriales bacterium]|nr:glycosyltransferase [Flavobacteriales bacterium]
MKVSLITVCRNVAPVIVETLDSVLGQTHPDLEVIVIDGASTDGTVGLIQQHLAHPQWRGREVKWISEPDHGIYDAMNKGLRLATGDIVGFVNAGDLLMTPTVVAEVVDAFAGGGVDAVYGDIIMVDEGDISQVKRTWKSGTYRRERFKQGWMPPHIATFIRRSAYDRFGHFNTDLRIAADYEILFRFLYRNSIPAVHIPLVLVRFRLGGMSNGSVRHVLKANAEVRRSWSLNGFQAPPLLITRKLWSKVMQFFH